MKKNVAIIGGGISGLTAANYLNEKHNVTVFEKDARPGGLIKCSKVNGNLYHMVGGHVFNSKRQDVLELFWSFFNRDEEFTKALRDARIVVPKEEVNDFNLVGYPIEDHAFQLPEGIQKSFIKDLLEIAASSDKDVNNFEEFLKDKFGTTLYNLYFKPYNEKIWKRDLTKVPLSWLEGKLPMPHVEEIILNNFRREQERNMVHSSFFYAKHNGSQFIADRLAEKLNIKYNSEIEKVHKENNKWRINDTEVFDEIIFAGNIKQLGSILQDSVDISSFDKEIEGLEFHGTTSVLCYIDEIPYSWVYMPDARHSSHRIICTGNFSKNNNAAQKLSVTIEFTDFKSEEDIMKELKLIPYNPEYISHTYTKYTYPIQNTNTRDMIQKLKNKLQPEGVHLLGRFAEWEYYNMDAAMGAALDFSKSYK